MGTITEKIDRRRTYVDVNVFIYAVEAHSQYLVPVSELFDGIDRGDVLAVTSELSLVSFNGQGVQDIYRGSFLRPNGPAFFSPGRRPGSLMSNAPSPNGATQPSRPRRYVSPFQGCRLFPNPSSQGVALG